jgi:hypothetical protein
LRIGKGKYLHRLFMESIKWGGTLVLYFKYLLLGQPKKGRKLIRFRRRVTQGLLSAE